MNIHLASKGTNANFYPKVGKFFFVFSSSSLNLVLLLIFVFSFKAHAISFPVYDFTFYNTVEDSVAIANSEKFGFDITGYSFVGKNSNTGIYLRVGVQTPYETIFNILDGYISIEDLISNPSLGTELFGAINVDSGQEFLGALNDTSSIPENPVSPSPIGSTQTTSSQNSTSQTVSGEESGEQSHNTETISSETTSGKKKPTTMSKLRRDYTLSITVGPSFRYLVSSSLMWYLGMGFSLAVENYSTLATNESFLVNTLQVKMGLDIDTGFRIDMTSNTTFRIGLHFTGDLLTYSANNTVYSNGTISETIHTLNADVFTTVGEKTVFRNVGYVGLAHTLKPKNIKVYTYSNTTEKLGKGIKILN